MGGYPDSRLKAQEKQVRGSVDLLYCRVGVVQKAEPTIRVRTTVQAIIIMFSGKVGHRGPR